MAAIETLRGYVNTWNCDENAHLNVQFYFRFFEDAAEHFLSLAGVPAAERRRPAVRHVRYHRELRADNSVRINSRAVLAGADLKIVHMMYEASRGELAATCLDTHPAPPARLARAVAQHAGTLPPAAGPRSLGPEPVDTEITGPAPAGATVVLRSRVRPEDCGADGIMFNSAIVGRNSDASSHFWDMVGITRPWLKARGLGRVAVEMKLCRGLGPFCGDLIHVLGRPIAIHRSTVVFEQRFVSSDNGGIGAVLQVTGLTMNIETRRAEPLPEDKRAEIEAMLAGHRMADVD